jgi:hypothetical protein
MKNLQLTRALCVLVIIALLTPIGSLVNDTFFTSSHEKTILAIILFFLLVSLVNYSITIRYCSQLIKQHIRETEKSKFIFFLIMSIVTFLSSVCISFFLGRGLYEWIKVDKSYPLLNNITDITTFIGLIFFALLGPIIFFMQLRVRKSLISTESSIEQLIESIGSENQNNS